MAERFAWIQAGSYSGEDDRNVVTALLTPAGAASLLAKSGVLAGWGGDLAVTAQGGNMNVVVAIGKAFVAGSIGATQASYFYMNDAAKPITLTAANGSNPRRDLIVVQIEDAAASGGNNTGTARLVTGTPAASPVAPAVPANSIVLAEILLPAGAAGAAVTAAMITDRRPYVGSYGRSYSNQIGDVPQMAIGTAGQTANLFEARPAPGVSAVMAVSAAGVITVPAGTVRTAADDANLNVRRSSLLLVSGTEMTMAWTDPGTVPSYLWGGDGPATARVYPPSRLTVGGATFATTAGSAPANGGTSSVANQALTVNSGSGGTLCVLGGSGLTLGKFAGGGGTTCSIDNAGNFGRTGSSRRYKKNIEPAMTDTEALLNLTPVEFDYKREEEGGDAFMQNLGHEYGLIAEELEEAGLSQFVVHNYEGQPDSIRYDRLAVALLPILKSQAEKIEALEERLNNLEGDAQ